MLKWGRSQSKSLENEERRAEVRGVVGGWVGAMREEKEMVGLVVVGGWPGEGVRRMAPWG